MSEWESIESSSFPKKWKLKSLDQYMQEGRGICYGIVQPGFPDESGIPVIRVNNLRSGRIVSDDVLKVSAEIESQYSRSRLRGNEILISLVGNVGEIVIVDSQYQGWNVARAIGVIPINDDIDKIWLKYWLQSAQIQQYIKTRCNTTVQITLNLKDVSTLPILEPSLEEQGLISSIPFALDRKISNLRQQNETLERIAQTLFKHWFVDFEFPNEDGKPYKSSGGEMVRSELGEIPAGWHIGKLGDVVNVNAKSISNGYKHTNIEYIDISSVGIGNLEGTSSYRLKDAPSRARRLVTHGNVIWSGVRPNRKSYLFISHPPDNLVVSTGFITLTPNLIPSSYLYSWVTTDSFVEYLTFNASGSAYPAVKAEHFEIADVLLPEKLILNKFHGVVDTMREKIYQNALQIQTLTKTRDVLLPKLMSGKLRITE